MRRRFLWLGLPVTLVVVSMATGSRIPSDTREALANAPRLEYLSVHPVNSKRRYLPELDKEGNNQRLELPPERECEGHEILGTMEISHEDCQRLLSQLGPTLAGFEPVLRNRCYFSPRHALRTQYQGHLFEMLICYQCGNVAFYRDHTQQNYCEMRYRPSPDLANEILRKGNLPLAPDR
jgi:hypothetical protein